MRRLLAGWGWTLAMALAALLYTWIARPSVVRPVPPLPPGFGPTIDMPWAMTLVPETGRIFVLSNTCNSCLATYTDILTVLDSRGGAVVASRAVDSYRSYSADNPTQPPVDAHDGRVLLGYADKVEEYDARSGRLLRTDPPGVLAQAADPRTGHLFVPRPTRTGCADLAMLDAATRAVLRRIPLGPGGGCAATPILLMDTPTRTLYALRPGQRALALLDPANGAVRRTVPLPLSPALAMVMGANGRVVVAMGHGDPRCAGVACRHADGTSAMLDDTAPGALLILDGATGDTVRGLRLRGGPLQVLVDERRRRLYVLTAVAGGGERVATIDATTGDVLADAALPGWPVAGVAIDGRTGLLLLPNSPPAASSDDTDPVYPPEQGRIGIFDPIAGTLLGSLLAGGNGQQEIAADQGTGRVYVANSCAAWDLHPYVEGESWLHHLLPFLPSGPPQRPLVNWCPPTGLMLVPRLRN